MLQMRYNLDQCFPNFSTSRYPWPCSSYLMVPLEENTYFYKLVYFLIISYVRNKVVYCCWVSVYALINDVILFIYLFLFLHLAVPLGSVSGTPGYRGTPVGKHWFRVTSTTTWTLCTTFTRLSAVSPAPSPLVVIRLCFALNTVALKCLTSLTGPT
jgi:hypothetical protein